MQIRFNGLRRLELVAQNPARAFQLQPHHRYLLSKLLEKLDDNPTGGDQIPFYCAANTDLDVFELTDEGTPDRTQYRELQKRKYKSLMGTARDDAADTAAAHKKAVGASVSIDAQIEQMESSWRERLQDATLPIRRLLVNDDGLLIDPMLGVPAQAEAFTRQEDQLRYEAAVASRWSRASLDMPFGLWYPDNPPPPRPRQLRPDAEE